MADPLEVTLSWPGSVPTSSLVGRIAPPHVAFDPTQTPALHTSTLQARSSSQKLPSGRLVQAAVPLPARLQMVGVLSRVQSGCETWSTSDSQRASAKDT